MKTVLLSLIVSAVFAIFAIAYVAPAINSTIGNVGVLLGGKVAK